MGNRIMSAIDWSADRMAKLDELYWSCWECHESDHGTRSWPVRHARLVHSMGFDYTTQRMV